MNILLVSPCYEPALAFGGTVTAIVQMSEALQAVGNSVKVYTTNSNGYMGYLEVPLGKEIDKSGVSVKYFHCNIDNKRAFYSSALVSDLKNSISDFDIVYISAVWQYLGVRAAKIAEKNKVPYVYGLHGSFSSILMQKKISLKRYYYKFLLKPVLEKADALHLTAHQELNDAKQGWIGEGQKIFIPNIIDPNNYYEVNPGSFKSSYAIPKNKKVILTVSRPDWMKRVDLLLECLVRHSDAIVVYAGNSVSPIVDKWKERATELGVSDRFFTTGILQREELLRAYAIADVFCLISENENFGMVVAEAMLCNCPVIVTKQAAITEYLEVSDSVKTVGLNTEEISAALEEVLSLDNNFENKNRQIAIDQFGPKTIGKRLTDSLSKIVQL